MARTSRSRWQLDASRARAQPRSRRASRPAAPLPHVGGRKPCASRGPHGSSSHHVRHSRAATSRTACESSWMASVEPKCFDSLPQARRTELVKEQAPELRSEFMTEPSARLPPLDCGKLGKLTRPTLLVTGERSPAMFLLVTAELERCLEGESQVMVPDAGHGMIARMRPSTTRR